MRTEGTFIANQASLRGYEEAGIKHYRFVARLDQRTSRICLGMHKQIFKVKDAIAGVNLPPLHPWCRSTTVPVFTQEEIDKQKEIDEDNKKIRKEYIEKCKKIKDTVLNDKTLHTKEEQAKKAHELRMKYKHEAREKMKDREVAEYLEKDQPGLSFEKTVQYYKKKQKNLTNDEIYDIIIDSSTRTNKNVNASVTHEDK